MRGMLKKKMRMSLATKEQSRNEKEGKKDGGGSDQRREGAVEKDGER